MCLTITLITIVAVVETAADNGKGSDVVVVAVVGTAANNGEGTVAFVVVVVDQKLHSMHK